MSVVGNHDIRNAQTSDRTGLKRKLPEGEDEINVYQPQHKYRNIEYVCTSSPSPLLLNSSRHNFSTHALTEPLCYTPYFSASSLSSFASENYLKARNENLIRKPKRKNEELELPSPSNKLIRLSQSKDKSEAGITEQKENLAIPRPTQQKECEIKQEKGCGDEEIKDNVEDNKTKTKDEEVGSTEKPEVAAEAAAVLEVTDEAESEEIAELMETIKCLPNYYKLVSKIGEGAFSTVYKALDIRREYYNNQDWENLLLKADNEEQSSEESRQFVALKHVYSISSPLRVANEIDILYKLRDSPCISPLITAFREQDQVFIVMPHISNDDFCTTFFEMTTAEIKFYFRSLFTALDGLHEHNIIHRDIKPLNFLYNRKKKIGYLIDFGLSEYENKSEKLERYAKKLKEKSQANESIRSSITAAISRTPLKSATDKSSTLESLSNREYRATPSSSSSSIPATAHSEPPRIIGYIKNDARYRAVANGAGTIGYKAPEVLFKFTQQTCAVDVWSAGVILLSFMTGRYPFFWADEDTDSVMELAQIYGYDEMRKCAREYKRLFFTNINIPKSKIPWCKIIEGLNKKTIEKWDPQDYKNGLDLLERCLDLNHRSRITAKEALGHPFCR